MPTYPALNQQEGTARKERGGVRVRVATNGKPRGRAMTSYLRGDPVVIHPALTLAEFDALKLFHEDNRGSPFDFYYVPEAVTITCMFLDPPFDVKPFRTGGGIRFRVQSNLIEAD